MENQEKKKEIITAASACFARYGYEKTTLDDIGKLVGLNKASLYYYFKNKESIYAEVIYSEVDDLLTRVFTQTDKTCGYKQEILSYLTERLKFIKTSLNFSQLSVDSAQKIAPLFAGMYGGIIEKEIENIAGILERAVKNGEIDSCETLRVAKSILRTAESITNRIDCKLSSDKAFAEASDEIQFTVSLMLDGLKKKS